FLYFLLDRNARLERVANTDGLNEAQIFEAIVGQHRTRCRINEHAGRGGNNEITMGYSFTEKRFLRGDFVKVRVEMIAGQTGEIDNIRFCHGAAMGKQALANLKVFEMFSEWVNVCAEGLGAGDIL